MERQRKARMMRARVNVIQMNYSVTTSLVRTHNGKTNNKVVYTPIEPEDSWEVMTLKNRGLTFFWNRAS